MRLGTVLVTGVTTFIGCHLVPAFAAAGYRVVGAINTPVEKMDPLHAARWRHAQPGLAAWTSLDMTDPGAVGRLIAAEQPRLWIQLAGIGKDFASDAYNFGEAVRVDLLPLGVIYRAMAEIQGSVLAAGSSMEYGGASSPHQEDVACLPDTPYGLAKLGSTLRARQLASRYGVPTRVARLYTLFGEFDSPTRLVARLVERLRAGLEVGVAPNAYRDVCYVTDVVNGYIAMAADCARDSLFDVFNLSRGAPTELREIARLVAEQVDADPSLIVEDQSAIRAAEPAIICGASAKAQALLGWAPRSIAEGLSHMLGASTALPLPGDLSCSAELTITPVQNRALS